MYAMHPLMIASAYAPSDDNDARQAIAADLDWLSLHYPYYLWAGDFNSAIQSIDTTAKAANVWKWLCGHVFIECEVKDNFDC